MVLNRFGQVKIDGVTVNELDYTSENYPFDSFDDIIPTRSGNVDIRSGENEIFVLANHRKLFVNFYKYGSGKESLVDGTIITILYIFNILMALKVLIVMVDVQFFSHCQ